MSNPIKDPATIKGRYGDFEYGYVGKRQWIVRDRRTGKTVATGLDMASVAASASRLYLADKGL